MKQLFILFVLTDKHRVPDGSNHPFDRNLALFENIAGMLRQTDRQSLHGLKIAASAPRTDTPLGLGREGAGAVGGEGA